MKRKVKQHSTGQWVSFLCLQTYHRICGSCSLTPAPVFVFRRRVFLASRVQDYPNSDSRYQLMRCYCQWRHRIKSWPHKLLCLQTKYWIARNHRALSCDQCTLWCHMKCGEVKLKDDKRLQQMDQFNWICPACFLTALPFADASILSDEGECCAQTLNTSNFSNTSVNSLPEFIKSRNNDDR